MSSNDTPKTILLKGSMTTHGEAVCAEGAIKPGMLVGIDSQGRAVPHATAAGQAATRFAREASMFGKGIDDNYVQHDTVFFWHARAGDQIYALLEPSANVAVGAILESSGDGQLQAVSGNFGIVRALEAVNSSGAANFATRIKVEVL